MATEEAARAVKEIIKNEYGHLNLFCGGIGLENDPENPEECVVSINVRSKRDKDQLPTGLNGVKIIVRITGRARANQAI